jgi:UDP-glucose 4-epimerase
MKCLFIGSNGYIGKHLMHRLRAAGHETVTFESGASDAPRRDIAEVNSFNSVDWEVDRVFLFAGVTGTTDSFNCPEKYVRGNELGLLNVLNCIRHSGHKPRVVFPSSRLVYKGAESALPETAELEARTVYAGNKIACEQYLRAYANSYGIPHSIFRICVPYGNLLSDQYSFGTVGNFINQAKQHGKIRLYGGGEVRRTFTHIDDLCRLIVMGAEDDACANQTFNIPGEDFSLREAAACIGRRFSAGIERVDWPSFDLRIESGSTVFDGSRLLSLLDTTLAHDLAGWTGEIA